MANRKESNKFKGAIVKCRRIAHEHILFDDHKPKPTVIIAGVGRSGTTWLSNIINCDNKYRYIFEPFNSREVKLAEPFKNKLYLRPDDHQPQYVKPATDIINGNVRNKFTDAINRNFLVKKRLIKAIRMNLSLKWLNSLFPEIPIIFLLRHPCAVAHSQIQLKWGATIENFLQQKPLVEDFLHPFKQQFDDASTLFERHIVAWCVENYVPLKQFKAGQLHLVFYENLCTDPASELEKIFTFLNTRPSTKSLNVITKPSNLSRDNSAINTGQDLTATYKTKLSADQIKKATKILQAFGLDQIYGPDPTPLITSQKFL
jgi:hypothetical protein